MGEEFLACVCGSTWWPSPRVSIGFSPCFVGVNHEYGSFGWPTHDLIEIKASSSTTRDESSLTSNQGSILFDQFIEKTNAARLPDSTLQRMDTRRSPTTTTTTTDWSQNLLSGSGSNETSYKSPMVQENMSSTINELKHTSATQGVSIQPSLPMSSTPYSYPSTLIENLFGDDQLRLENQTMNFPSITTYQTNLNEFSPLLAKLPSSLRPSLRQQQEIDPSHLINNNPFWNGSSAAPNDISTGICPSAQLLEKSNFQNLKPKFNNGTVQDLKKSIGQPAVKRPRIETPSPLPTFKVRKEKLGDRITALQQLVSPFGKTDTASVLQEAIEYIKFLHDQVNVLSTPYIKNGALIQHQQNFDITIDPEKPNKDLRGRGLCLVPISSTFPVASETTVDFWTPTFGGTFS